MSMKTEFLGDIYVEITSKCNLKCLHCYNKSSSKNDSYITKEMFRRITDECVKNGIHSIAISGGEPLINRDCIDIINLITENSCECRVVTNGTLLTRSLLGKIKNLDKTIFQISLHGSRKEIHEHLTGTESFEGAVNALSCLKEAGVRFSIKFVATALNYFDFENVIHIGKTYGAKGVSVSFLQPYGRAETNEQSLSMSTVQLIRYYLDTLEPLFEENHGFVSGPKIDNTRCPLIYKIDSENKVFQVAPRIDVNGNVYPCAMFIHEKFAIGNILHNTLEECFQSSAFYDLLRYITLREKYIDSCNTCSISRICGKGCPASSVEKEILPPSNYCDMMKWKVISDTIKQRPNAK